MTVYRHHGECFARIYTQEGAVYRLSPGESFGPKPIVGFNWTQNLPQAGASSFGNSFALSLLWTNECDKTLRGRNWSDLVTAGDWIQVIGVEHGEEHPVELGVIKEVDASVEVRDGAEILTTSLSCTSWGGLIDETLVWFCELAKDANLFGERYLDLFSWTLDGPADVLIKSLLKGFLRSKTGEASFWNVPFALAAELRLSDPTDLYSLIDTTTGMQSGRGATTTGNMIAGTNFALASMLSEWCNPTLNELFFDLRPNASQTVTPMVVLRERPFPLAGEQLSAWLSLPRLELRRDQLTTPSNLTRTDRERYNVFALRAQMDIFSPTETSIIVPPVIDAASVRQFGLKKFELETRYLMGLDDQAGWVYPREVKRWLFLVANWYVLNHEMLSGSVRFPGFNPGARVGRVLLVGDGPNPRRDYKQLNAYIEGVTLSWQPPPRGWTTTLRVTRGVVGAYTDHLAALKTAIGKLAPLANSTSLLQTDPLTPPQDLTEWYSGGSSLVVGGS